MAKRDKDKKRNKNSQYISYKSSPVLMQMKILGPVGALLYWDILILYLNQEDIFKEESIDKRVREKNRFIRNKHRKS